MGKTKIANLVYNSITKVGFQLKKHSPEILVAGGIVGIVTSAVLACRATLRINDVLDETKNDVDIVRDRADFGKDEAKKELTIVYIKTGVRLARLYLPSVGLAAASIVSIIGSSNLLCKRNAALAAAYTALNGSFKDYRARLISRFGVDVDNELRYHTHNEKIEEVVVDDDGKTKKVKKTVQVTDLDETSSGYARYYDHDTSEAWEESHDYNMMFLRAQQNIANNLLIANGYLFLNDVYKMLGIDRSIPGQAVGWVYDKNIDVGDNYIDFNITETYKKDGAGELIPTILLDFNVDGTILERSKTKGLITA
jgi:hypothetical protein